MAWTPKFTFSVTWDNITGKPLNYPTTWSLVAGKPSTFPSTWATVSGKPETATRWPSWNEVTGKPAIPQGTVTSVSAGAGMSFSTITGSGAITLGSPSQVNTTSVSEVTSGSHSHSLSSLFSDTTSFTADNPPEDYPSSVVSLSRVGTLGSTGWPTNGVAANFMAYGSRYGQLYFSSNSNQIWFRTGTTSWRSFEELWHSGNFTPSNKADIASPSFTGVVSIQDSSIRHSGGNTLYIRTPGSTDYYFQENGTLSTSAGTYWHSGNDGAGSGLDADYLRGFHPDTSAAAGAIARRDESADLHARLFRSNFASFGGSSINAGASLAYRNNDTSDDAIRFASDPTAIRGWLGLGSASTSNSGDFVATSGNQSNLSGDKSWSGSHTYLSGSQNPAITVTRTSNVHNALFAASTTSGTIYFGQGVSGSFAVGDTTNLHTPANLWLRVAASGTFVNDNEVLHRGNFATGSTSQYLRGNGSLATFPSIPSSSDYVATSGNQSGLSGNKTWSGTHTWNSGSVTSIQAIRNNSNVNSLFQATTNRGSVYFGYGNASSSDHFAAGTSNNLTGSALFFYADSSGLVSSGTVSDSIGNVRKPEYRTANGTITLSSNDVNRIVEKSNNSSYTYTIPSGHGSHGDIITFVNSGTSGTLTINAATGVTIYRNGSAGNISVGPGSTVTVYRSATANRWIA